ncbi:MAG: hypothetical protein GY838_07915 [bacterium]|nr:hypothetical protein [bacterium]
MSPAFDTPNQTGQATGLMDAPPASEMMMLLDKLLTSGALYPPGHVNFTAASDNFRAALTADREAFVIIEAGDQLRIGPVLLDAASRGVERVASLMEKLGLHRITIHPQATEAALHDLSTSLLGHRREADDTGHLAEADFAHLPDTVQVVPKVFAKQWAEAGAASIGEAVDAILDELSSRGTHENVLQDCRETLQELFTVLMARSTDIVAPDTDPATRPQDADKDHRLAEGARSVGGALRRMLDQDGDLSRLAEAIREAADDMEAGIDRAAAQVLLKALGSHAGADFEEGDAEVDPRCLTDDSEYDLPLEELRHELSSFEAGDQCFESRADTEDLFIYLNFLSKGGDAFGRTRALAEVTRIVAGHPEPEYDTELHEAVGSLLEADDLAAVDPVIERIASVIRERGIRAVISFWGRVCSENRPGLHAAVWPHLVGEFLADTVEGRDDLRLMQTLVTSPSALEDPDIGRRLERLAIFGEVRSGFDFCSRPERRYFPVYSVLLLTSRGKVFGGWLQDGLVRGGPDRQMRTIAAALGPFRGKQRKAYAEWLKASSDHNAAPASEVLDELRRRVSGLKATERSEPWLTEVLDIIGRHCPASGRRLLERISDERRMLLFKAWPQEAREAASRALATAAVAMRERKEDD